MLYPKSSEDYPDIGSLHSMPAQSLDVARMFHYNSWARHKYLDLFERLPWKVMVKHQEASFSSIRDILLHNLQVNAWWFEKGFKLRSLKGMADQLDGKHLGKYSSMVKIREVDQRLDRISLEFVDGLTTADLHKKILTKVIEEYAGKVINQRGREVAFAWEEALWHMVEEELQHRGEMIALLWAEDIEPPWTSYMRWRFVSAARKPKDSFYFGPSAMKQSDGGYVSQAHGQRRESRRKFVPSSE